MAYGVIRVENASGITLGKDLFSLKCESAIENGHVVVVGDYISGEVRAFSTPTAKTAMGNVAIIASEEIVKTKGNNTLAEFINEKGSIARGYRLVSGDIYGLTAECFEGTPAKGNVVELMAGTKLKTVKTATEGSTVVGKIVDVEGKYFVVEIA